MHGTEPNSMEAKQQGLKMQIYHNFVKMRNGKPFATPRKEEGLYCKPEYRANVFQYMLVVLSTLFIFDRFGRQDQSVVYIFRFNTKLVK